jgi:hypothetical protein
MCLGFIFMIILLSFQLEAENNNSFFSFTDTSFEKIMSMNIVAIDYFNDINKYHFYLVKMDNFSHFLQSS